MTTKSRRSRIYPGDGDPRHGTAHGYSNLGCRCVDCKDASRIARWRRTHGDGSEPPPIGLQEGWVGDQPQRRRSPPPLVRFFAKVNKDGPVPERRPDLGPCWLWQGALTSGYGVFGRPGYQQTRAHIWSWEQENGPVPDGLELDHLCFVRACVRPSHLEAVTHRENCLRWMVYRPVRTHCIRGHELAVVGERIRKYDGARLCLRCRHDDARDYYQRKQDRLREDI